MEGHWKIVLKDGNVFDDERVGFIEITDGFLEAKTGLTRNATLYLIPNKSINFCEWVEEK